MQCRNCSSNSFVKTDSGNYRCEYCGTLFYDEKAVNKGTQRTAQQPQQQARQTGTTQSAPRRQEPKKGCSPLVIFIVIGALIIIGITSNQKKKKSSTLKKPVVTNTVPAENDDDSGRGGGMAGRVTTNAGKDSGMDAPLIEPAGMVIEKGVVPDIIGNHYYVLLCSNSGRMATRMPEVTIRLYKDNTKVGSGKGYGIMSDMNPGDVSPVLVLIQKVPAYTRYEVDYKPEAPYTMPDDGVFKKRFKAALHNVSFLSSGTRSYRLKGAVSNTGAYTGQYVQVAAVLYDKSGAIVGYDSTYISEKKLAPGDFDFFDMNIYRVSGKPVKYKLFYYGRVD